jgi:SAM-dependent methyltransferase
MNAWYDQEDWWEASAQVIFQARAWEHAPQQVEQVLALAGMEPPIRVLDLPCGVGRHSLEFARMGCTVTAVDRTSAYLSRARSRAEERGINLEFVQADMREFARPQSYDLAVNLFTSFGYFVDQRDDMAVLANFYASLRPGGVLVMDLMGKEVLARIFRPRDWHALDDGTLVLEERRVAHDWTWIDNRWIIVHGAERRELPFSHRLYGASDLHRALSDTGFDPIRIFGDLSGSDYDHEAQRLVAVARKPQGTG